MTHDHPGAGTPVPTENASAPAPAPAEGLAADAVVSADALGAIALFADLSAEDLAWIAARCDAVALAPGEALFAAGDPPDWMYVLLQGSLEVRTARGGVEGPPFPFAAGGVSGMLPFSRMTQFSGVARAVTPARVARFPAAVFPELLRRVPALEPRFVALLSDRVREFTRTEQQQEKLAALGKLAAGLAHELNNPASAVRRGAADLRARHAALEAGADPAAADALAALRRHAAGARPPTNVLDRSDAEDAVADWLAARGVAEAHVLAATFVEGGAGAAALAAATAGVPAGRLAPTLAWLEAALAAATLADGIEHAAGRISELVGAVKAYTHMDRAAERGPVDVRAGLDSTLAMFAHRLREKRLVLEREDAPAPPRVVGHAGELNQVWTNLIDNAIDAAPAGGRLGVRTAADARGVTVEVRDDGPGIPPELLARIWEPFFTTKDVGQGTGLGLDIARRIVVAQHGGELGVTSAPGDTRFTVRLPLAP